MELVCEIETIWKYACRLSRKYKAFVTQKEPFNATPAEMIDSVFPITDGPALVICTESICATMRERKQE